MQELLGVAVAAFALGYGLGHLEGRKRGYAKGWFAGSAEWRERYMKRKHEFWPQNYGMTRPGA